MTASEHQGRQEHRAKPKCKELHVTIWTIRNFGGCIWVWSWQQPKKKKKRDANNSVGQLLSDAFGARLCRSWASYTTQAHPTFPKARGILNAYERERGEASTHLNDSPHDHISTNEKRRRTFNIYLCQSQLGGRKDNFLFPGKNA